MASDVFLDPGESLVLQYDNAQTAWREQHPHKDYRSDLWGSAKDGSATISSSTTLTRSMYYDNLTITTGAALQPAGFDIYVNGILDISTCAERSHRVYRGGGLGGHPGRSWRRSWRGVGRNRDLPAPTAGWPRWRRGGATAGTTATNAGTRTVFFSSPGGGGGTGGTGTSGNTGGAGGSAGNPNQAPLGYGYQLNFFYNGATAVVAGQEGGSGGGGGGDGTHAGGGGGGSGATGGVIRIFARKINRGTNSNVGVIQAIGGNGRRGRTGECLGDRRRWWWWRRGLWRRLRVHLPFGPVRDPDRHRDRRHRRHRR